VGEVLLALVVGIGAGLWLDHVNAGAWTGHDQTTGLLMAQDCLRLSTCHLTSVDSGVRGFTNGAIWLHLVTAVGLLGGTATAVSTTLLVLMAAGITAIFLCTWRWLHPGAALPAALFALMAVASGNGPSAGPGDLSTANLVDASAVFLPTTLFACALLIFVSTSRSMALVVAAVFASHAANTHVAAMGLLPSLIAAAALAGRRPVASTLLAMGVYTLTTLLSSPEALRNSLSHLDPSEKTQVLVGLVVLVVVCSLASARFRRLGALTRAGILAAWMVAPLASGALLLLGAHRELSPRYLVPVIAPLAVALALLPVYGLDLLTRGQPRLARRGYALLAVVAAACVVNARPPPGGWEWTYQDGQRVAEHLAHHGWCYAQQFARLQTPQCTPLTYAVMPFACHATGSTTVDPRRQERVWLGDPERLPELPTGAEVLPTGPRRAVVLSAITSWLDKTNAELCVMDITPDGRRSEPRCSRPEDPEASPFLYSHRLGLGFRDARFQAPFVMTYAFPVRPDAGETHRFAFLDDNGQFPRVGSGDGRTALRCGWQVTRVEGLEADQALPANPVRLTSRTGAPGRIVIERLVGAPPCLDFFPGQQIPCHWETTPGDPSWMQEQGSL
jgi:hypothetical protein